MAQHRRSAFLIALALALAVVASARPARAIIIYDFPIFGVVNTAQTARINAANLGARVDIACMDLLEAASGAFDLIVSNPPYVSRAETSRLQREVREHEPHVALFAADDGLAAYRQLIPSAQQLLRSGGYLLMEIGFGLEERVLDLFDSRWKRLPTATDLQGIPRIVCATLTN